MRLKGYGVESYNLAPYPDGDVFIHFAPAPAPLALTYVGNT
jgi:hypothetical protein